MDASVIDELDRLRDKYEGLEGLALLRVVLREDGIYGKVALVSSFGTQSIVLLDMVASVDQRIPVFFLDTGKLFPETQEYRRKVTMLLGLRDVRVISPARHVLATQDPHETMWRTDPDRCCDLRKTAPLRDALNGFVAWITGRKRFQGDARSEIPIIEADRSSGRIKLNPLASWSEADIEAYRRLRDLPAHPLAQEGYSSIGCISCTRPAAPGEPPRAGRWPWSAKTECGIHLNL